MLIVRNGEYLSVKLTFTRDKRDAAWFMEDRVSKVLVRLRLAQTGKYLGSLDGNIFDFCDKKDDSTLFLLLANNTCETIRGYQFQIENFARNHFQEHGFLVIPNVLPPSLVENAANKILSESVKTKQSRISNLFALDQDIFSSILKLPILKYLLESFFQEGFHLTTYSSNTLFGDEKETKPCFHVDYPYHTDLSRIEKNHRLLGVQVIIPLTDFNFGNGATLFIPKSFDGNRNDGTKDCCFFLAQKGSLILYRADLVHSQGCNTTNSPRIALLANFAPLCVPAKDNILDQAKQTSLTQKDGRVFI